jgi:hypothetical protein
LIRVKVLETGCIDGPAAELADHVVRGVKEKFQNVRAIQRHMNDSVEAGREYVEAYVDFIHHYERLYAAAHGAPATADEHAYH